MVTRQKFGLVLVAASVVATLLLQVLFSCLYSPEVIQEMHIVPAPANDAPILFILATNWIAVTPLLFTFVAGLLCVFVPPRPPAEEPQWIEIKYVH